MTVYCIYFGIVLYLYFWWVFETGSSVTLAGVNIGNITSTPTLLLSLEGPCADHDVQINIAVIAQKLFRHQVVGINAELCLTVGSLSGDLDI